VLDGRLVRGANGAAGEIGFHPYGTTDDDHTGQLTEAVIGLCAVADPQLAVLSGPAATTELAAAVEQRVAETSLFRPRVMKSGLETGAVARGALALAWEQGRDRVYFS
jgi:predicted NBD/HSP70 family sugar kinase